MKSVIIILISAAIAFGFALLYIRYKMTRYELLRDHLLSKACSIIGTIGEHTNISEALDRLCLVLTQNDMFEYALVCLYDKKTRHLSIQATGGTASSILNIGKVLNQSDNKALYDSFNSNTTFTCNTAELSDPIRALIDDDNGQSYVVPFGCSDTGYGIMIAGPFVQETSKPVKESIESYAHLAGGMIQYYNKNALLNMKCDFIKHFSNSIANFGPQINMTELKHALVDTCCHILDTEHVALFTIDPCLGGIDCTDSPGLTTDMESAFLDMYDNRISNRECRDSWVLNEITATDDCLPHQILFGSGIRSIIASPIRSGAGATGAIAAFYPYSQYSPKLEIELMESIASIASLAISYALSLEQLQDYLEDFAGSNQELSIQATIDSLTNLPNQRKLQQTLSELFRSTHSCSTNKFSFIMLDVDHFKNYNDTYGHQAGDAVLCNIAKILSTNVRQSDLAARYGGEEFALIVRSANKHQAKSVAERIRNAISHELSNGRASVTVSMGIAEYPADGNTPVEIIEKADRALYQAKITGRNRVVMFESNSTNEYGMPMPADYLENEDLAA